MFERDPQRSAKKFWGKNAGLEKRWRGGVDRRGVAVVLSVSSASFFSLRGKRMSLRDAKRSIRAKCLDCCCGSLKEVRVCEIEGCALWEWRMGKDPRRRSMSEEELAGRRESARRLNELNKSRR